MIILMKKFLIFKFLQEVIFAGEIAREIKMQLKLVLLNYSPHVKMAAEYEMTSVIRGFHIYCAVWTPVLGEELESRREVGMLLIGMLLAYISQMVLWWDTYHEELVH